MMLCPRLLVSVALCGLAAAQSQCALAPTATQCSKLGGGCHWCDIGGGKGFCTDLSPCPPSHQGAGLQRLANASAPSFPDVFSATRLISEPDGHVPHQPGYVRSNYRSGWHLEARSVDNVTFDEGIQHVAAQTAWTVWRDVQSGKESRSCGNFAYHAPIAQQFLGGAVTQLGKQTLKGVDCVIWAGTYEGPAPTDVHVWAAADDSTHIVRVVFTPSSPTLIFDFEDWKTGSAAEPVTLPDDCPAAGGGV